MALAQIEQSNRLVRGPNQIFNLTPPSQRADGYRFNPRDLTLTADQLKDRYDAETWAGFEQWAGQVDVPADADGGKSAPLLDWLHGSAVAARAAVQHYPGEGGVLAGVSPLTVSRHADAVQRAAAALDQAALPAPAYPVAVRESKLPLAVSGNTVPDGRGYIVNLNPNAKNPEETFVHEWAHVLKRMMPTERRAGLVKFLKSTENYRELKKLPDGNYWRKDDELLARAFTQYIAETAGDDALQSSVFHAGLRRKEIYWSGADVETIIKKFKEMFP
ncbi:MAG: hypothetical protein LBD30_03575 [Verrucomicrobiales bacterium]|nr:hypothetical protein [Verrucomicrobiales bacterium]